MGKSPPLLAGLILAPLAVLGTDSIYINTGTISGIPPNVDATNFYNSGSWNITTTPNPYQTAYTLNYTNNGTMIGTVGWEFDYGPLPLGGRGMSASFLNDTHGMIEADDSSIVSPPNSPYSTLVSYLLISATNVVNKGTLIGGVSGETQMTGSNVNLSRSIVKIGSGTGVPVECSVNNPAMTNFTADTAIYDQFWGTNGVNMNSAGLWNGTVVTSPIFLVDEPCAISNVQDQIAFVPTLADSISMTNPPGATGTNITEVFNQAVFVAVSDPNIFPADRYFANSDNVSNLFETVTVSLTSALGGALYLSDTFASGTNSEFLRNANVLPGSNPLNPCTDPTFRPANYILERADCQGYFAAGSPGFGPPATNFFFNPAFTNPVVTVSYADYSAFVDDLVRDASTTAVTNLPGRIVVNATNLNLNYATITSGGAEIALQANNFLGSTGAVISCQNLSYNLGSAGGNLNVLNLMTNSTVPGLRGTVSVWSAVWTNGLIFVNGSGTNATTNTIPYAYHVLLVDATALSSTVPVTVQDLILHSTNIIVSDSATVQSSLLFDGQSLTLQGALTLSANIPDWSRAIAPSLLYFTNNGTLTIPQDAHFGDDGPTNYAAFVNNGAISAGGSETINSVFYLSGGSQNASGGYFVTTPNGKIEDAAINSGADMDFSGGFLKLDNSTLSAGNQLNFSLTNALYDSGDSANNVLTCGDGFNLWVKPATGDLLGTAITSQAFNGAEVDSVWAGVDYGATAAGYSNNVALGQLILSLQGSASFPALFYFSGASVSNALYVDLLDLSKITNLDEMLQTDPNLVIYYAAAKLPSSITMLNSNGIPQQEVETNNPLNGQSYYVVAKGGSGQVPQEAEEVLNGKLSGHLRWVASFAGPNSSVDVIINGQTVSVNRALRYSLVIDSNGNGIPNGLDPNPFNSLPVVLSGSLVQTPPPAKMFAITWLAQTNLPYQVQYTTSLLSTNWLPLLNYTNTASTNVTVTVWDTNAVSSQRFYRVSHP